MVANLAERVRAGSNGRITVRIAGPDAVRPPDQFDAVSKGLFDLVFTTPAFHAGAISLALATYAMRPDPVAWRDNGLFEAFEKDYERHNLKLLAVVHGERAESGAYQLLMRQSSAGGELAGQRIRGSRNYQPLIEGLGGLVVLMPDAEIAAGLQAGTIDGVAWPVGGAIDFRWHEHARVMLRPTFGRRAFVLAINGDRLRRLAAGDRTMLVEIGKRLEITGMAALEERMAADIARLKELGVAEVSIESERFNRALARYYDALWEAAGMHAASAEPARGLSDLAQKTGHAE
ncbi:MAG: hypothetical protein FJX67_04515 [Alphaproteobacteria bacterium]|nr:hypothetical protein [Alphaproteobacteria bacterium]